MRALFASEERCVLNLFSMKWNAALSQMPVVMSETIDDRPKGKLFNRDFILHFVDRHNSNCEKMAAACSVLPNALGAELFLVVEKTSLIPTALELNGGSAFPITHFTEYIEMVELAVENALRTTTDRETTFTFDGATDKVSISSAAFARVLVAGPDVTFLWFPRDSTPVMRGRSFKLKWSEHCQIGCYVDGQELVCIDGWIRKDVATTEMQLVAI